MAFTVPDEADVPSFPKQSGLSGTDFDIISRAAGENVSGFGAGPSGVESGCAATVTGTTMVVTIAAGIVRIGGRRIVYAGGTVTPASTTTDRKSLICINTSAAATVTNGTGATDPVLPDIPANSVAIWSVEIPANDTALTSNQLVDKRMMIARPPKEWVTWYGADPAAGSNAVPAFMLAKQAIPQSGADKGGTIFVPRGNYLFQRTALGTPVLTGSATAGGSLTAGSYIFGVTAWCPAGETVLSNEVTVTTSGGNLTAHLTWPAITGAKRYRVYMRTVAGTQAHIAWTNTNSYDMTALGTPDGVNIIPNARYGIAPPAAAPTATLAATGGNGANALDQPVTFLYKYAYYNLLGQTTASAASTGVTTTGTNRTVVLTFAAPPAGSTTQDGIYVFRSDNGGTDYKMVWAIRGTATTWTDTGAFTAPNNAGSRGTLPYNQRGAWKPSPYNTTGVPPAASFANYAFVIDPTDEYITLEGEASNNANFSGTNGGTTIVPGDPNMACITVGDGVTLMQAPPIIHNITFGDITYAGNTYIRASGVDRMTIRHCGFKYGDCAIRFDIQAATDCAWNRIEECSFYYQALYSIHLGDSVGTKIVSGEAFMNPGCVGIWMEAEQSTKINAMFFDGPGPAAVSPDHSGGSHSEFHACKFELCDLAAYISGTNTNGRGRGISFYGCSCTSSSDTTIHAIGLLFRAGADRCTVVGTTMQTIQTSIVDVDSSNILILTPGQYADGSEDYDLRTSGPAKFGSTTQIGPAGGVINNILRGTATLGGSAIANGASVVVTITVTGAAVGDAVMGVGWAGISAAYTTTTASGWLIKAMVTATDTVVAQFTNNTGGSLTPASSTVTAWVVK